VKATIIEFEILCDLREAVPSTFKARIPLRNTAVAAGFLQISKVTAVTESLPLWGHKWIMILGAGLCARSAVLVGWVVLARLGGQRIT
jgi:hypothetical protein